MFIIIVVIIIIISYYYYINYIYSSLIIFEVLCNTGNSVPVKETEIENSMNLVVQKILKPQVHQTLLGDHWASLRSFWFHRTEKNSEMVHF